MPTWGTGKACELIDGRCQHAKEDSPDSVIPRWRADSMVCGCVCGSWVSNYHQETDIMLKAEAVVVGAASAVMFKAWSLTAVKWCNQRIMVMHNMFNQAVNMMSSFNKQCVGVVIWMWM